MRSMGVRRLGSIFSLVLVASLVLTPTCFAQGGFFLAGEQSQQVTDVEEEPGIVATVFGFVQNLFDLGAHTDAASSEKTFTSTTDDPEISTTTTDGGGDGDDDDLVDIGPGLDPQN